MLPCIGVPSRARTEGTLLEALDATLTPMGGRLLRAWLLAPLRQPEAILHRQRGVAEFVEGPFLREDVRELLRGVLDTQGIVKRRQRRSKYGAKRPK